MSPEFRELFSVDYAASDAEVFVRAVKAGMTLKGEYSESFLPLLWEQSAGISPTIAGLPYWCPDLSNDSRSSTASIGVVQLSEPFIKAIGVFADFRFSSNENSLCLSLVTLSTIKRSADIPYPALDFQTYTLHITRDILGRFCDPMGVGAWMIHLHELFATSGNGNFGLGTFLWYYSEISTPAGDIFGPGPDVSTNEPESHRLGTMQSACRCIYCLVRLGNSIDFLGQYFRRVRDELLETAETHGYEIQAVALGRAAFALRTESGLFEQRLRQDPTQEFAEDVKIESYDYLHRDLGYSRNILQCLQGMYIFTTTSGQFGYSPRLPSAGDLVTVVPGGQSLHIISQDKSRYVGAASVYGYMEDALTDKVEELSEKLQEVTLH